MEDWRATQEVATGYSENNRKWDDVSSTHDSSVPWRPDNESLEMGQNRFHFDDPDTFIRNSSEPVTTLLEQETCAEHVIKVWDEVSRFIVENMKDGYAVKIAGLGTFTFAEEFLLPSVKGFGRARRKRTPFMILSEFVVRMYDLITPLHETLSNLPVAQLNLQLIAQRARLLRRTVDGVITDVLQSFARALVCNKSLEFPFPNIGKLQVSNRRVNFKFYADFCTQLDYEGRPERRGFECPDPFILPGAMTPLRRHIPTADFRSVFHLKEVRSVHDGNLLAPVQEKDGHYEVLSRLKEDGKPVNILIEDSSKSSKFKIDQLYGSQLRKRYAVSWVRQKRDYLNPSSQPYWPPHHYHVVESSVALPKHFSSLGDEESTPSSSAGTESVRKTDTSSAQPVNKTEPRPSENFYEFYSRVAKKTYVPPTTQVSDLTE